MVGYLWWCLELWDLGFFTHMVVFPLLWGVAGREDGNLLVFLQEPLELGLTFAMGFLFGAI